MRLDSTELSFAAKGMAAATTAIQKTTPIQLARRPVTRSESFSSCCSTRTFVVSTTW